MRGLKLFLITFILAITAFPMSGCLYGEPEESNMPKFEVFVAYDRFGEYIDKSKDRKDDTEQ